MRLPLGRRRGQAAIEYALSWVTLVLPLITMIIFASQLMWVWHSVVDYTREGARYAATHCYQPGGTNVLQFMRDNVPLMADQQQFREGQAEITVSYFSRNADTGLLEEFACDGSDCSKDCIPDVVRVSVAGYQYRGGFSYFGLQPISLPNFSTSMPMESAGCSPDTEDCLP